MSDRDALHRAILANPDDDTPRLVLADWLDEHGGEIDRARARFIRAQCGAARAEPYSATRHDLDAQAAALEGAHGKAWATGLEGLAVAHRFARGFVEEVTVYSKRFVAEGQKLFAAHPIRGVKFADTSGRRGVAPPEELCACPHLARLHTIGLTGYGVDDAFVALLVRSPHLAGVRALRLERPAFSPDALRSVLESDRLSALAELSLRHSDAVGSTYLAALAASPALARLKVLEFRGCVVGADGARALAGSEHAAGLEVLNLTHDPLSRSTPIRGPGAVALAESPHLRGLKNLTLMGQELRKKGAEAFATAFAWPGMKRLSLRVSGIPAGALAAFAANPAFGSLAEFEFNANPIRDADLEPLRAAFPRTVFLTDDFRRRAPAEGGA